MALFGVVKTDEVIFMGDRTRIDVSQSFATPDENQSLTFEVKADGATDFVALNDKTFLDWLYSSTGTKTITVRVTAGENVQEFTQEVVVRDPSEEKLLATDFDLMVHEPDVYMYLPAGRSSFNVIHYKVLKQILKLIADRGITRCDGSAITAEDIVEVSEFNDLAVFMALTIIFEGVKNQVDDVFSQKAKYYSDLAVAKAQPAFTKLDLNQDGEAEKIDTFTSTLVRG